MITAVMALKNLPPIMRVVVIFCVVALIPGYFATRYSSEAFWNYSYKSFEVTARPSFQNPKAPVVGQVTILPLGGLDYTAYAEVTNQNFELSADNVGYKFSFKTAAGETAYSATGRLFFLPAQKRLLVAPRFSAIQPVVSGELALDEVHWAKPFSIPKVSLTAIRPNLTKPLDIAPFTVEAAVRNDSPYQLKKIELAIVAYGQAKQVLAVSMRQEFTVNPNEVRKFPVTFPGLAADQIVSIDLIPQTDVLDPGNLLLMESPGSPGSDLRRPTNNNF